jgi:aspartate kinase
VTESQHGAARIKDVQAQTVESSLLRGEIAVVAGFQGVSTSNELTTLGRGGSDTTAVALAAAIGAERCDIYTDVEGVYTADPNLLSDARRLPAVSYEEMLELTSTGTKVMNPRSIEVAMDSNVPIRVRSTFVPNDLGTLITHRLVAPEYTVAAISLDMDQAVLSLKRPIEDEENSKPLDAVASLFTRLQELNIPTDMVMLLAREDEPMQELAFTVHDQSVKRVRSIISSLSPALGEPRVTLNTNIARISVVGRRLTSRPEIIASVFEALNIASIPVQMVATGDMRISVLLPKGYAQEALRLIHNRFNLAANSFFAD